MRYCPRHCANSPMEKAAWRRTCLYTRVCVGITTVQFTATTGRSRHSHATNCIVSTTCTTVYVALSCVDRVRRGNDVSRLPMCVLDVTGHVSIDHSKNGNAYTRPPRKTYWAGCTITSVMSSMSITLSWTLVLYPILRKLGSCMVVLVSVDC